MHGKAPWRADHERRTLLYKYCVSQMAWSRARVFRHPMSSSPRGMFEDWLVAERERLREMALEALARLLAHQMKAAGTERAIQTAVRLLALDPLQESAHRTLMRLYSRQGRGGSALKQYQVCVSALQRELGAEPEPESA